MTGTSRINREVYVRFCGRLVVKFLRPTRRSRDLGQHAARLLNDIRLQANVRPTREGGHGAFMHFGGIFAMAI